MIFQDDIGMESEIGIFLQPNEAIEQELHTFRPGENGLPTSNRQGVEVRIGFVQNFRAATSHGFNLHRKQLFAKLSLRVGISKLELGNEIINGSSWKEQLLRQF